MGYPLISIIMPVHDGAMHIHESIHSVLQEYSDTELIIFDCSSDNGSLGSLKPYERYGDRFRLVRRPGCESTAVLNEGIAQAQGSVIGWLTPGDIYYPDAMRQALLALEEHPDWAMVYGRAEYINDKGEEAFPYPAEPCNHEKLMEACYICQSAAFYRRKAAIEVGGMDESLRIYANYDFWIRLSKDSSIGFIDKNLGALRIIDESKRQWKEEELSEIIRLCLKNYGFVSGKWLAEYADHHWTKGVHWLIKQFQAMRVFSDAPKIIGTNSYLDGWLPSYASITIKSDPPNPIRSLLVKGKHHLPHLFHELHITAHVNGNRVDTYTVPSNYFTLEIPVECDLAYCTVELHTHETLNPAEQLGSSDYRNLGFVVEEIIPLGGSEIKFYKAYQNHPSDISQWLLQNDVHRKITTTLT